MNLTEDISPTDFEQLCYDLLGELGFTNISWRKGTSFDASPADQGRDIEATHFRSDLDGTNISERWFVECKQYKKGVPPQAFQGALAWAQAENPHTLLIAVAGFLSNSSKEYLKNYELNRKPSFRIRTWELPDLEKMLFGRTRLLNKFSLVPTFPYIDILHPAHKLYIIKPPVCTITYFLSVITYLKHLDCFSLGFRLIIFQKPLYAKFFSSMSLHMKAFLALGAYSMLLPFFQ